MKIFFSRFRFVFLILLFASIPLYAYQMTPLTANFKSSGVESSQVYTLTNDSDSPIAIEMKVMKRIVDLNGEESMEDAPAYFSVQPSKMIIKPQATQVVRVQYRGPRTVNKEMSFRIIAEQIPYSRGAQAESEGQSINFLFVYSTSAYVEPSRKVVNISSSVKNSGDNLIISIINTGSVHQLLNDLNITITDGNNSYTLSQDELGKIKGANLLTDSEFQITILTPPQLENKKNLSVEVSYK